MYDPGLISQVAKAGYASCTGLSIFLVCALRSVGIPARVTGALLSVICHRLRISAEIC